MAKMKYLAASGQGQSPIDAYSYDPLELSSAGNTSAKWIDTIGDGYSVTFFGADLKFKNDVLVSGTVSKILFEDAEGADVVSFKGVYDAAKLGSFIENHRVAEFFPYISRGDDVMIGSARVDYIVGYKGDDVIRGLDGNDILDGLSGKDRLVGGDGSDIFIFNVKTDNIVGNGHDTIIDFDAKGGGDHQDYIAASYDLVTRIHQDGAHTVIEFGDHDSLTLLGVKRADIDETDFTIF